MSFNIWNNLDEIGLFLGLTRLDSEANEAYFNRIRLFGKWKYKTDYLSQVHSIPLQTGLLTTPIVKIISDYKYECTIDYEFFYLTNEIETIRVYINDDSTLDKILQAIDNTTTFTYSIYNELSRDMKLKFLVRNTSLKLQSDYIEQTNFNLANGSIKRGTLSAKDKFVLITEKDSILDLKTSGDYFVDYETGYIQIFAPDFTGAFISYKYYDPSFRLESTELNLIPVSLKFKYGLTDENIGLIPLLLDKQVWG